MPDTCQVWKNQLLKFSLRSLLQKIYRAVILCGRFVSKNLKLLPNTCFDVTFQKKCIVKFSAILVCLLLRWNMQQRKKRNNKFDGPQFRQQLTLICQVFRNNKPFLKYLTDRKLKMPTVFIFEIKGATKDKIFNFLKGRFSVIGDPMDVVFSVL